MHTQAMSVQRVRTAMQKRWTSSIWTTRPRTARCCIILAPRAPLAVPVQPDPLRQDAAAKTIEKGKQIEEDERAASIAILPPPSLSLSFPPSLSLSRPFSLSSYRAPRTRKQK